LSSSVGPTWQIAGAEDDEPAEEATRREMAEEAGIPSDATLIFLDAMMSRVFISYGRADAEDLVVRLKAALRDEGHDVWLDRHEIKAGRAWEEEIEQGILASDVVIALLSPHAVRRPDGVCLDEISLARYNQKRIIPAMVIPCRPPLSIAWIGSISGTGRPLHITIALSRD
jgi:hypothetical protein